MTIYGTSRLSGYILNVEKRSKKEFMALIIWRYFFFKENIYEFQKAIKDYYLHIF